MSDDCEVGKDERESRAGISLLLSKITKRVASFNVSTRQDKSLSTVYYMPSEYVNCGEIWDLTQIGT